MQLIQERNNDLYASFCRVRKGLGKYACHMSRKSLAQFVVEGKAPGFYITPETALKLINKIETAGKPDRLSGLAYLRAIDVYRRFREILEGKPGLSRYAAADEVVNSEAPRFYIDWDSALRIITEKEKGK
jgi:hypothetical protein